MPILSYLPLCDAIVLLMHPLIEITIHDLSSDTIFYIKGNLSKRKVGEPSLLTREEFEIDIDKIIYPKFNWDGRLIKSVSIPIADKWLICINCDISVFNHMKNLGECLLNSGAMKKPKSLFSNDWQEKLHSAIHSFLQEKSWNFNYLSISQKKEVIKHLFNCGAFTEKKAADYLANILQLGRATIFKYLKEWRNQ